MFLALSTIVGLLSYASIQPSTTYPIIGKTNLDLKELLNRSKPLSIVDEDGHFFKKAKEAIEQASERIRNGGGSGNQDDDLFKLLKDEMDALINSSSADEFFETIFQTAGELGKNGSLDSETV